MNSFMIICIFMPLKKFKGWLCTWLAEFKGWPVEITIIWQTYTQNFLLVLKGTLKVTFWSKLGSSGL